MAFRLSGGSTWQASSSCWGAKVLQKIVADKTDRHFNVKLDELMKDKEGAEKTAKE